MPRPLSQILAEPKDEEAALLADALLSTVIRNGELVINMPNGRPSGKVVMAQDRRGIPKFLSYNYYKTDMVWCHTLEQGCAHAERLAAEGE